MTDSIGRSIAEFRGTLAYPQPSVGGYGLHQEKCIRSRYFQRIKDQSQRTKCHAHGFIYASIFSRIFSIQGCNKLNKYFVFSDKALLEDNMK
jgi:hypothetical protein